MTGKPAQGTPKKRMVPYLMCSSECTPNYQLSKKCMAIMLEFQPYSVHYTALQMKNIMRSTSAINPVTMENMDDFHYYKHTEAITHMC